ncbi:hypothetical protein B0H13DRAFT_2452958 [Mycena leptocephala]|nr:hypothetical protein B0H13DRAFT_2452958 [Mycena leptocephala]
MLKVGDLPPKYWCDIAAAAVQIGNYVPTTRNPGITPYKEFSKHKPDVSHLQVFGCTSYMKIPTKSAAWGGKLAYQSLETQLIGYFGRGRDLIKRAWEKSAVGEYNLGSDCLTSKKLKATCREYLISDVFELDEEALQSAAAIEAQAVGMMDDDDNVFTGDTDDTDVPLSCVIQETGYSPNRSPER